MNRVVIHRIDFLKFLLEKKISIVSIFGYIWLFLCIAGLLDKPYICIKARYRSVKLTNHLAYVWKVFAPLERVCPLNN
jgi:hypothetical protein